MNGAGRTISTSLAATEHAPAEVRALVDTLPLTIAAADRDDLKLALSELVVTRLLEATGETDDRIDVQLILHGGAIHCEVADGRRARPRSGGLVLLDRIASRWGTLRHGHGVWFELDLSADRRATR